MVSIDKFIDFVEQLLQRDIHFLTSDEVHLKDVLHAFRMAKKDGKVDRKTLQQLVDHYKVAGDVFNSDGEYKDLRPIDVRMKAVLEKGSEINPIEYYFGVASAVKYADLIYGVHEED